MILYILKQASAWLLMSFIGRASADSQRSTTTPSSTGWSMTTVAAGTLQVLGTFLVPSFRYSSENSSFESVRKRPEDCNLGLSYDGFSGFRWELRYDFLALTYGMFVRQSLGQAFRR